MKHVTAAVAIALCAAFIPVGSAEAQAPNLQFQTPLNYRFSVQPKSHVFSYNRTQRRHGWRNRHHRPQYLPVLAGPSVIYQNGEIEIPPPVITGSTPSAVAQPALYRLGESGGCGRQQILVPGTRGRSTVNVWRC